MPNHLRIILISLLTLSCTLTTACSKKSAPPNIQARAEAYFGAEEYDKARVEYMNLLRAEPANALAIKRMGLIWMEQGVPLRAVPFLAKAKELDPKELTVRRKLASAYLSLNRRGEARKEAAEILVEAPADEEALLLLAETAATPEERAEVERLLTALPASSAGIASLAQAGLSLRAGDLKRATAEAQRAAELLPQSARVMMLQGSLAVINKDMPAARAAFQAASDLSPARSAARIRYADFLLRSGDSAEAKKYLDALTASKPDFLPGWEARAQIALSERKADEALAFCENIFARDPANLSGRILEAKGLLLKNDGAAAVKKLEELVKNYPGIPDLECQLARAYLQTAQVPAAITALNRALVAQAEFEEAVLLLAEVNLRVGDPRQAIVPLEELVKKKPGHNQAEPMLAEAYRRSGRVEDTVRIYRRRLNVNPQNVPQIVLLGIALRQAGQFEEARAEFTKALGIAPTTRTAIEQLLEMDIVDKKFDDARSRIAPVLKENPDSAGGNYLLARICASEGKLPEAEVALQKSLKADPSSVPAAELFATVSLAANKVPEAIAQLTALTVSNPKNAGPFLTLGLLYEKSGQPEKARDAYEHIMTIEPENAPVLNNLAYVYLTQLHDLAKGHEAAKRARALRPDDAAIADTFGWSLYLRREYPQALAALQEAVQKLGDQPEIQYHLGMAHYAMGETELARVALSKAVSAKASFPGKDEAQRRLDLLAGGGSAQELSVEQLEAMLKDSPHDVPALLRLADAYEKLGKYPQVESALQRVLQENAQMIPALVKLVRIYAGPLADPAKALATAKKARDFAPNDPAVSAVFAKATYATGKTSWAFSLLQEAARRLPEDAVVQLDLASAAYVSGQFGEAERVLGGLTKNENATVAADAQAFLALLRLEGDRQELVAKALEIDAALKRDAGFPPALVAKAALHVEKGERPQAIAIYVALLERLPECAPAQYRLAVLYADDSAKLNEALALIGKVRSANPEYPGSALLLARLSYLKKDYAQTRSLLQKAGEKTPLDAVSLFYLGMSHLHGGDPAKARETLEKALAAQLAEPMAAEARQALDGLAKS